MGKRVFAGSGILSGFIIKRDKLRLLLWIIGLTAFFICFVPVFKNMFNNDPAEMAVTVAMMQNPAMIAIIGPVYGAADYTTGAMYANFMLVFSAMLAAVMNISLVTRHTRHDEELGRLEVIRSLPVGRLSNLASTLIVAVEANAVLTILTAAGMYLLREDGMTLNGCVLFAAGVGAAGLFFAAATAVCCQITANNRTASALAYALLMILYIIRAGGDIQDNQVLTVISPLGLVLRTETFVRNYWWPVAVILIIAAAVAVLAFYLAGIRDLNRGLLPERPGRRHGSFLMNSPNGLAVKLLRSSLIIWALTMFILAAMYGSVFGDLDSFLDGNEMLKAVFQNSQYSAAEQFMALLMVIMSLIGAIPVLNFIGKVSAEEKRGHMENVIGKSVSRYRQMTAYLIPAVAASLLFQLLSALGFWSVGSMVLDTTPSLKVFLTSAALYLPPIWVMIGLSVMLTAYLPGRTYIIYIYLAYTFFAVYLGTIAGLPDWTTKITPFGYIPQYPIEEIKAAPLVVQTIIAAVLIAAGMIGYRRRDVKNPS